MLFSNGLEAHHSLLEIPSGISDWKTRRGGSTQVLAEHPVTYQNWAQYISVIYQQNLATK